MQLIICDGLRVDDSNNRVVSLKLSSHELVFMKQSILIFRESFYIYAEFVDFILVATTILLPVDLIRKLLDLSLPLAIFLILMTRALSSRHARYIYIVLIELLSDLRHHRLSVLRSTHRLL